MPLFTPKESPLPLVLGARVEKSIPPRDLGPIWQEIRPNLYAHRETGMMKFTPPTPPKGPKDIPQKTFPACLKPFQSDDLAKVPMQSGYPPKAGFYYTSLSKQLVRFYNGAGWWSTDAYVTDPPSEIIAETKITASSSHDKIFWYPEPFYFKV